MKNPDIQCDAGDCIHYPEYKKTHGECFWLVMFIEKGGEAKTHCLNYEKDESNAQEN